MIRKIEIEDTLQDRIDSAISDIRDELVSYLDANQPSDLPCLYNDLDYSGAVHDIIGSAVPVYTSEIKSLMFLYGDEIEQAFDDAGIGEKSDNWPMGWKPAAIYCYIEQKVNEWYCENAQCVFDEWLEGRDTSDE